MKKLALAGAVAALLTASAGVASAAVPTIAFLPGPANSPTAGYQVIDNFDTAVGLSGVNYQIGNTWDANGAPPGNSLPFDSSYLSVLGGGGVDILFSALTSRPVTGFEFDWGSIDSYNSLAIHYTDGTGAHKLVVVPGSSTFPNAADGNQYAGGTNGVFIVTGAPGTTFDGLVLTSTANSFEIDNLAIAVPEPASWALIIAGLGAMGAALRSRRKAEMV